MRSPRRTPAGPRPALRRAVAAVLLGLAAACRTPPAPASTQGAPRTVTTTPDPHAFGLGPGDVLRVDVLGHPELSTPPGGAPLDERGRLHLPGAGAVELEAVPVAEAEERVRDAYRAFMHDPDVTVALVERRSKRFFVLGQIRTPGPHPMEGPLTAMEALGHGGFFLDGADRRSVFLVRPHGEELEVHRFDAATPGPDGLVQVLPGDVLFVRRRGARRFQEEILPLLAPWQIAVPAAAAAGAL